MCDINKLYIKCFCDENTLINKPENIDSIIDNVIKSGEKSILLTIINKNNRRRYLGVKIN